MSGLNLVKINQKGLQFSYSFDLKNTRRLLSAYRKMIAGNVLYAQLLALKKKFGIKESDNKIHLTKKAKRQDEGKGYSRL